MITVWNAEEKAWESAKAQFTGAVPEQPATQLMAADQEFAVNRSSVGQIPAVVQRCVNKLTVGIDNFKKTSRAVEHAVTSTEAVCDKAGKKVGEGAFAGYPSIDNPKALLKGAAMLTV